ncbi:hypothetical protein CGQ36_25655 [Nocardiopsis dassonvillei]|nr:hypothetical protein CGQ36_25655 [Nocardiopsis dassonvillei]
MVGPNPVRARVGHGFPAAGGVPRRAREADGADGDGHGSRPKATGCFSGIHATAWKGVFLRIHGTAPKSRCAIPRRLATMARMHLQIYG